MSNSLVNILFDSLSCFLLWWSTNHRRREGINGNYLYTGGCGAGERLELISAQKPNLIKFNCNPLQFSALCLMFAVVVPSTLLGLATFNLNLRTLPLLISSSFSLFILVPLLPANYSNCVFSYINYKVELGID